MSFTNLEKFLDSLAQWRIPGLDCAVYHKREEVFRHQAGKVSPDSLYNLFSVTKPITCAAALQLFERGAFLLNDPLHEYLPEFRVMYLANGEKAANPIRVRDLFMMAAGFSYDTSTPQIKAAIERTGGKFPTKEIARALSETPLLFEPGTHWNYSLCHDVLGAFIEVVSGKKFGLYLQENIFEPLGMSDTGFIPKDQSRLAPKFIFDEKLNKPVEMDFSNNFVLSDEYESGGAGLTSSMADLCVFAETMCRKGLCANGNRILSSRTVDLMRLNHLDSTLMHDMRMRLQHPVGYGYGLGVHVMADKAAGGSPSSIGEFGWRGAAGTYLIIDPDAEVSIVYAQQMLGSHEPFVFYRLRNVAYSCLD